MTKNQNDSLGVSKWPALKPTEFGLRGAVDQSMSLVTEPAPKLKVPSPAAELAAAAKQATKAPPAPICQRLDSEQMIRQAGTHSLRFAFAGSDDVADLMGLVDAPYKIRDDTGAMLAQGKVGKDGRLPVRISRRQRVDLAGR